MAESQTEDGMDNLRKFLENTDSVLITDRMGDVKTIMRRLSRNEGAAFKACRIMDLSMIAKELVLSYTSKNEPDLRYRFVLSSEADMIMFTVLKNVNVSSVPKESVCLKTAAEILRCMGTIRLNDPTEEYLNGKDRKLSDMKLLLSTYEERLRSEQKLDYPMLLTKASECLDDISKKENCGKELTFFLPEFYGDAQIGVLKETEYTSAEDRFLKKLEKTSGKNFERNLSLLEEGTAKPLYHFFESYGIAGEVRYAAEKIREEKIPFGDVAVVYASDQYENMLRGEFENNGISFCFVNGSHASSEDYVSFMLDLIKFVREDYSYEALEKVVSNPVIKIKRLKSHFRAVLREGMAWGRKQYIDYLSRKEAGDDEDFSAYLGFLKEIIDTFEPEKTCEELYAGLLNIAKNYTPKNDPCKKMLSAKLKAQLKVFSVLNEDGINESFEEKLENIEVFLRELRLPVKEEPDSVAVFSYGAPFVTDRKVLFVLGLSNENISKPIKESPVFSDEEIERYAEGLLDRASEANRKKLREFLLTLGAFAGSDIYLGCSSEDTVKFLENSRSLIYMDLMKQEGCTEKDIEKTGYSVQTGTFKVPVKDFYDAYKDPVENRDGQPDTAENSSETETGKNDKAEKPEKENGSSKETEAESISASRIQTLLYCPLQYYYRYVEYIPDVNYARREPENWLQANQKGNLFHRTLEDYVNEEIIKNRKKALDLLALEGYFRKRTDEVLEEQPVSSVASYEKEKQECFDAVKRYAQKLHDDLNNDGKGKKVLGCEVDFKDCIYTGGQQKTGDETGKPVNCSFRLKLNGQADRVDGYVENGVLNLDIIDYKTGNVENKAKEIEYGYQIQHYVYAICIKEWAEKNIDELKNVFSTDITGCRIASMKYEFPFEDPADQIDRSKDVKADPLKLPEKTEELIGYGIGAIQNGEDKNEVARILENRADQIIQKEKEIEKSNYKDHCRYCNYGNICRLKIGIAD